MTNSAYKTFTKVIDRVNKLNTLYEHTINTILPHSEDASDILRSQVVYIISGLDRYIHDLLKIELTKMFLGETQKTKKFNDTELTIEQIHKIYGPNITSDTPSIDENIDRIEEINRIIEKHNHISYQSRKNINEGLQYIRPNEDRLQRISELMQEKMGWDDANNIKKEFKRHLKLCVTRRNEIVHQGDMNLQTGELANITKDYAATIIDFIIKMVESINELYGRKLNHTTNP